MRGDVEQCLKLELRVEGMSCARVCAKHAAAVLAAVPSVQDVSVDFPSRKATVMVQTDDLSAMYQELMTAMRYSTASACHKSLTVLPWGGHSIELHVQGMMCLSGCGNTVQRVLLAAEHVVGAEIYLAEQRVRVVFEGARNGGLRLIKALTHEEEERNLCRTIETLGFEAAPMRAAGGGAAPFSGGGAAASSGGATAGQIAAGSATQLLIRAGERVVDPRRKLDDLAAALGVLRALAGVAEARPGTGWAGASAGPTAHVEVDLNPDAASAIASANAGDAQRATPIGAAVAALVKAGFAGAQPALASELVLEVFPTAGSTRAQLGAVIRAALASVGGLRTAVVDLGPGGVLPVRTLDGEAAAGARAVLTLIIAPGHVKPAWTEVDELIAAAATEQGLGGRLAIEPFGTQVVTVELARRCDSAPQFEEHAGQLATFLRTQEQVVALTQEAVDGDRAQILRVRCAISAPLLNALLDAEIDTDTAKASVVSAHCNNTTVAAAEAAAQLEFRVVGMACVRNCALKLSKQLLGVDAVAAACVSFEHSCAIITPRTAAATGAHRADILAAIAASGFEGRELQLGDGLAPLPPLPQNPQHAPSKAKEGSPRRMADAKAAPLPPATVVIELAEPSKVSTTTARLAIEGMTCSACVAPVQGALQGHKGVLADGGAKVNLTTEEAIVQFDAAVTSAAELVEAVEAVGYGAEVVSVSAPTAPAPASITTARLAIEGMTCSACVAPVQGALQGHKGVLADGGAKVNLTTEEAIVQFDAAVTSAAELVEAVEAVGYGAELISVEISQGKGVGSARMTNTIATLSVEMGEGQPSDVASIEATLHSIPAVLPHNIRIDAGAGEVHMEFDGRFAETTDFVAILEAAGHRASIKSVQEPETLDQAEELPSGAQRLKEKQARKLKSLRRQVAVALFFTFPVFMISMILPEFPAIKMKLMHQPTPGLTVSSIIMWVLTTPVQFGSGLRFYKGARKSLKSGTMGMDVLVAIGTTAAYFYSVISVFLALDAGKPNMGSHFFETAAMLISFVLLGKLLEAIATGRTSEAVTKLINLTPKTATLLLLDGDVVKCEKEVELELIRRDDVVKVLRGSRTPADGDVHHGCASFDEAMITGESLPQTRDVGDSVLGGTVCVEGTCYVRVTGVGSDTMLSQIARLVEDAQLSKAPIQAVADRISARFVPGVLVLSVLTLVVWLIAVYSGATPAKWYPDEGPFVFSLMFSMAVLVIACPCALGLATPTAVMVGTGVGAANGVLIKGGEPLERAQAVDTVVFDKTGTLTEGKPSVQQCILLQGSSDELKSGAPGAAEADLWWLAGSAELESEHPLGRCIVEHATSLAQPGAHGVAVAPLVQPENFVAESGKGLSCTVGGRTVRIGTATFLLANDYDSAQVASAVEQARQIQTLGMTAVFVAVGSTITAIIGIADSPKPDARDAIRALRSIGVEVGGLHARC